MSTAAPARLFVLGGASIEGDRGPISGRAAQRRRLALLAMLAANRRGMTRDKLIGYLWEEADTDRARRVLSEAIYVIRKSLGEDAVITAGDDVRLNPAVLWSDVGAFSDAIAAGQLEEAAALYRGPFLDGFFISEALEFDQWAERERDRLARTYARALQDLAARAEASGDFRSAATWWRQLVEHDKYGAAPTLGLMRALDAIGDRAAAIQEGRAHGARMKADLGAEPDAQVEAFCASLRDAAPNARPPERIVAPSASPSPVSAPSVASDDVIVRNEPAAPRKRRVPRAWLIAASVVVLLAAAVVATVLMNSRRARVTAAPPGSELVAVLPFTVRGAETSLGPGVANLVAGNLDGAGNLVTVDPYTLLSRTHRLRREFNPTSGAGFARDYGAKYFVLGVVVQTGSTYTLDASMYAVNRPDTAISRATQAGTLDSLHLVVDRLSQQLLGGMGTGHAQQVRRTAATTTTSFDALRELWTGEEHYRDGDYDRAVRYFSRAVELDPTFAIAHYRLSAAAEWNFDFLTARRHAKIAAEHSERLDVSDQLIVRAWHEFLHGNYKEAYQVYSNVRALDRTNVEALSGMGEVLVHYNPLQGLPIAESEAVFREVLRLAPPYAEVRFHLLEHMARNGNESAFDSVFNELPARNPQRLVWSAVRAFTFGDAAAQRRVLADMDTASDLILGFAAARIAAHTHNFEGAARVAEKLLARAESSEWKAGAHLLLAQIWLGAGNWPRAQQSLAAAEPLEDNWTRELSALLLLHPTVRATREQISEERARVEAWNPDLNSSPSTFFFAAHYLVHEEIRLYLLGLLSAVAGDTISAERHRVALLREAGTPETEQFASGLAHSLGGHIAHARGDRARAIEQLTTARIMAWPEHLALSPFYARAYDRVVLAKLTGDERWTRSLREGFDFVWTQPPRESQ